MAWSTGRSSSKGYINKHTFRVVLLVALAWIVVYNFLHYNQPPIPEEHVSHMRTPQKRPQHVIPDVNIAAAGPQVGQVNVDVSDGTISSKPPAVVVQPDQNAPHVASPDTSSTLLSPPTPLKPSGWQKQTIIDPADPITRLTLTRADALSRTPPNLLALVMTKDASSWGSNGGDNPKRTFASYLSMLSTSGINLTTTSLGLLTSSQAEFDLYTQILLDDSESFSSATIILHPGYATRPKGNETNDSDWRASRHDNNIQHDRRAEMARLRNYLMFTALGVASTARNILWIDADVYELSPGLIPNMITKMHDHEPVGIVTVISHFGGGGDYDLNAYRGGRSKPNEEQRKKLRTEIGSWTAGMQGGHHIHHVLEKIAAQKEKEAKEKAGEGAFDPAKAEFEKEGEKTGEEEKKKIEKRGVPREEVEAEVEVMTTGQEVLAPSPSAADEHHQEQASSHEGDVKTDEGLWWRARIVLNRLLSLPHSLLYSHLPTPLHTRSTISKRTDDRTDPWWNATEVAEFPGLLRLDAVGATVVMLKSQLVNQGLAFSTSYLVGTDWEGEGWDAVESEGLCVTARTIGGAGCFAMVEGFSRHCVG